MSECVVIGVDVGDARVGVAIAETSIPLPHATFARKVAVESVVRLVEDRGVSTIVVGWPVDLSGRGDSGRLTRATKRVQLFENALKSALQQRRLEVKVERVDERLSTVHAEALLDEANVFGKKRKAVVDQVAAVQILQSYLDQIRQSSQ